MGKIRWLGHSGFEIKLNNKTILIDSWLSGNPKATMKVSDLKKVDVVCVTHDHGDHLGDAIQICKETGATFAGIHDLGVYAQEQDVKEIVGFNIGGTTDVKGIEISMVQAFRSSNRGAPTGFIIKPEGKTICHAGDTGLSGDMKLIGEIYHLDVALIPIGDYYTMGPREAAEAVRLIKPLMIIPMHYGTFPVLTSSAKDFIEVVREKVPEVKVVALQPGEICQF